MGGWGLCKKDLKEISPSGEPIKAAKKGEKIKEGGVKNKITINPNVQVEAKVDQGKSESDKKNNRNQRAFGNKRNSNYMVSIDNTERRRYNTEKGRGVKTRGQKDKRPMDYHTKDKDARIKSHFKSKGIKYPERSPSGPFNRHSDDKYQGWTEDFYRKKYDVKDGGYKKTTKMDKSNKRSGDSKAQYRELHKDLAKEKIKTEGVGITTDSMMMKDKAKREAMLKKKEQDIVTKKMKKESLLDQVANAYVDEATRMKKEMGYDKGGSKKPKGPKPKDAALDAIKAKYKGQIMRSGSNQSKKVKGAKLSGEGKFKMMADKKKKLDTAAKKAGYKSTQDYVNVQAVRKGGLGT